MRRLALFLLSATFIMSVNDLLAQNKKEQILILANRIDSLRNVLTAEERENRGIEDQQLKEKLGLEQNINKLQQKISSLTSAIQAIQSEMVNVDVKTKATLEQISELDIALKRKADSIDSYLVQSHSVFIGNQEWTTMNLNLGRFKNGEPIFEARNPEEWQEAIKARQPAWSHYGFKPSNERPYGKFYNWYAVADPRGVCPAGWHVPSDIEWSKLTGFIGASFTDEWSEQYKKKYQKDPPYFKELHLIDHLSEYKLRSGENLKTTEGWNIQNGNDLFHFEAFPCGNYYNQAWSGIGDLAVWWTASLSTENESWNRGISGNTISRGDSSHGAGHSVRCLRD